MLITSNDGRDTTHANDEHAFHIGEATLQPDREGVPESSDAPDPHPSGVRILVMDDEEILLDIARQMCKRLGIGADTAFNGEDAVEMYRTAFNEGHPYDAVLLDMTIAGGMGGVETVAAIKKVDPRVKAVVMSGYSDHEIMAAPSKYGFSAMMSKPFRFHEFGRVLEEVLPGLKVATGEK
jgi:DNA-binding NtrC family response regulator